MAAHVKTALVEVQSWIDNGGIKDHQWQYLNAALNISSWTEDLDFDEWRNLRFVVDLSLRKEFGDLELAEQRMLEFMYKMTKKYNDEWEQLGQPRTREEWFKAKYPR